MNKKLVFGASILLAIYMLFCAISALLHFSPLSAIIDVVLAGASAYFGYQYYKKTP